MNTVLVNPPLDRPTSFEEFSPDVEEKVRILFNGFYRRRLHRLRVLSKTLLNHPRLLLENLGNTPHALGYTRHVEGTIHRRF